MQMQHRPYRTAHDVLPGETFDRLKGPKQMQTIHEFLNDYEHLEFDWEANGNQTDDSGWEYHAFTVTLSRDDERGSISFPWKQGLGVERDPELPDVLSALASDARAGELDTFEEFASEFGYDDDSLSAYRTWKACKTIGRKLRGFFGVWYDDLVHQTESL